MKRAIICGIIVIGLVAAGIISYFYTARVTSEIQESISRVSESYEREDFEAAKSLSAETAKNWEHYLAAHIFVNDKEHALEITLSLLRIKALAEEKSDELKEECITAIDLVGLYRENQRVNLANIF
ncbi:MAG: DUF4363 family protein [Ruminiclostridium sp.]